MAPLPGAGKESRLALCTGYRGTDRLDQGWAVIQPEGPHWVVDLGKGAVQVVQETNPPTRVRA